MSAFRLTTNLSRYRNRFCELSRETQQIEESLRSTGFLRSATAKDLISVLDSIASQNQRIKETAPEFDWRSVRVSTHEAVLHVDKCVGETKDTIIRMLNHRLRDSADCGEIRTRLCFLSIALRELQDALSNLIEQDSPDHKYSNGSHTFCMN